MLVQPRRARVAAKGSHGPHAAAAGRGGLAQPRRAHARSQASFVGLSWGPAAAGGLRRGRAAVGGLGRARAGLWGNYRD